MLDFIFATTHPAHFHSINLAQNPSHYPLYMRLLGSSAVAWLQESKTLGAGVWFNAFCEVQGKVSRPREGRKTGKTGKGKGGGDVL
jgi:translocator assembly and maintenance protein 41